MRDIKEGGLKSAVLLISSGFCAIFRTILKCFITNVQFGELNPFDEFKSLAKLYYLREVFRC